MHYPPIALALCLLLAPLRSGVAQLPPPSGPTLMRQAFDMHVAHPPTVASIGGAARLYYEVHLTNFARTPLTLSAVEVVDDATGRVLRRIEGGELAAAAGGPGTDAAGMARLAVEPGRRAIIYVELKVDGVAPARLRHRVEFDVRTAAGTNPAAVVGADTPTVRASLPKLGPPLIGGPWAAIYDPALENGHRRYVYAVGGRARIPGRFAIDWMRADDSPNRGAGAAVLAVADAVVAAARDDVAEIEPGRSRPPVALADATGNYIALDLGDGRYAFYEHLAPGLSVRAGDRVRRGQTIARVGSTGQAIRPHLHFHVADAVGPLAAEGLPYLLTRAQVVGKYPSIAAFEEGVAWQPVPSVPTTPSLPAPNHVFIFGGDPGPRRLTRR